ncbi:MAG TPA: acyl-CoA dehydratase activase-related protein [Anaerolineales bacterium]|nr:acyl-CoA dehydratase activase-related protein [Anaerolineales bacterium]
MSSLRLGIDVGSTTAKVVILNQNKDLLFSAYRRHNAETVKTLQGILAEAEDKLGDMSVAAQITGSAGLGVSERFHLPFIQEVVASAEVVNQRYPEVKTLIDIGGEDAKMIFFRDAGMPDIRMNGACAGGTGAFIDEMSNLLNVPLSDLDALASRHTMIYPMASRCGVFAKTDLQNLLSRDIPREDISASVFHAVVLQTLATLAKGYTPRPLMLFCGGPLTFLPALKKAFMEVLRLSPDHILEVENAQLLPAMGAALAPLTESSTKEKFTLTSLIDRLGTDQVHKTATQNRLPALFKDEVDYQEWESRRMRHKIVRVDISKLNGDKLFLGIDSGSTTTKIVLIDEQGRVAFEYYINNRGDAINAVQQGLEKLNQSFAGCGKTPYIARSMVTGYGEDLIRTAFGLDEGMVETLAHFRAAKAFDKDVSFIMDIGGQDMKAIFVRDGFIQDIKINEACSSGCGSFIESFARSMGYTAADFAREATKGELPCDLGTRCTVFMNSKVKQSLREGAEINDISAGLAYSVIKNALHKVLKVTNIDSLGGHIVVQGGTFRNPAVQKALENLLGREVTCPDMAELMGAYGAALTALDHYGNNDFSRFRTTEVVTTKVAGNYAKKTIHCHGCENKCAVTKLTFPNGNIFYSGNRCEKIYTNGGKADRHGVNLPAIKYDLLFDRKTVPDSTPRLTIGIPRVLNQFENFPFWNTLLVESGFKVQLSAASSNAVFQKGTAHIMSDNLCFPAKLVSGHIMNLIEMGVDRIFFPMVFYEESGFSDAANSYNCPVVTGYAEVVKNVIDPQGKYEIPLDLPPVNFNDKKLLKKTCLDYLASLGVPHGIAARAFDQAQESQRQFKGQLRSVAAEILENAQEENRPVILLLGRPYHIDPLINHKIPDILTNFGLDVITEDSIPLGEGQTLDNRHAMTQWEYLNRYFHAARWAGRQDHVEVVQLNSFGCGPDPFILEEVSAILGEYGKSPTVIRIDEIESTGSTKLRLRSMLESMQQSRPMERIYKARKKTRIYQKEDQNRTLIVPDFSPFCSPPIVRPFIDAGYDIVWLPPADRRSVDTGLKYANNEICYPGIITIGDLIKALQSGKYDLARTAIGFSQTGGQCRATSYVGMIKKALIAAGFENVPVVTLSTNLQTLNEQPGFEFNAKVFMYRAFISMAFTDALSDMYYSTVVREKNKSDAKRVADRYLSAFMEGKIPAEKKALLEALGKAVADFNAIDVDDKQYPKVGIVGEIFVKYNAFSNNNAAEWLMDQGVEVVMPTFLEFFAGGLIHVQQKVKTNIARRDLLWLLTLLGKKLLRNYLSEIHEVMKEYRRFHHHTDIEDIARNAQEILSLNHQYGEGWLIAGEITSFVKDGIPNVLCLQPFGCIANHIVAKGAEKKMRERYPQLNLLFLDADAGVSEVNFFNRMHFFLNHAKEHSRIASTGSGTLLQDLGIPAGELGGTISLTKSIRLE